jgi:hypothetical protein
LPAWPTTNLNYYQQIILEQAHSEGYKDITKDNLRNSDFVFILDEAQMTYGDSALWLSFVKGQNEDGVGISQIVFSYVGIAFTMGLLEDDLLEVIEVRCRPRRQKYTPRANASIVREEKVR